MWYANVVVAKGVLTRVWGEEIAEKYWLIGEICVLVDENEGKGVAIAVGEVRV